MQVKWFGCAPSKWNPIDNGLGKQNLIFLLNYRIFNEGRFHYIVDGLKDRVVVPTKLVPFIKNAKEMKKQVFG